MIQTSKIRSNLIFITKIYQNGHFVQLFKFQIPNPINVLQINFQCKYKVFPYLSVEIQWFLKLASGNHEKQAVDRRAEDKFGIMEERVGICYNRAFLYHHHTFSLVERTNLSAFQK